MLETVNLDNALAAQDAVNDAAYILAQTSSGETVKISKADLATVVAGLMKTSKLYPFMYRGICSDFNNATEDGYYHIHGQILNGPSASAYGVLITFAPSYKTQLLFSFVGGVNYAYFRMGSSSGWTDWTLLT